MIPKAAFLKREDTLLRVVLWVTSFAFIAIMIFVWIASERAKPVMLDLDTGKPVEKRPAL